MPIRRRSSASGATRCGRSPSRSISKSVQSMPTTRITLPMHMIRPSNAYCPGQLLHRVIPKAVVCGLTGRKLPLQGGGRAEKSYIHARDLGRAIHLVAEKAPLGTIYNVGPPEPTAIRTVVELTAAALGMNFEQVCEM